MTVQAIIWPHKDIPGVHSGIPQPVSGQILRIALVVGAGFSPLSLAAVLEVFSTANLVAGRKVIDVISFSITGASVPAASGMSFSPTADMPALQSRISQPGSVDAVFVCCGQEADKEHEDQLLPLFRACRRHRIPLYALGSEVSLLIKSGYTQQATPHWSQQAHLREVCPNADVSNNLFHLGGLVNTCSGYAASLDFAVRFLIESVGPDAGAAVCRQLLIGFPRDSHQKQVNSDFHRIRNAPEALKAIVEMMTRNIEDPLPIKEISASAGVSMRQIERMFAKHLSTSPVKYYGRLRLEVARQLIEQTDLSLLEVSLATGFSSPSTFSKKFKTQFNRRPHSFRDLGKAAC